VSSPGDHDTVTGTGPAVRLAAVPAPRLHARRDPWLWPSQPRTLLKHQVYRQYLHCWMGKICQKFRNSAIVDAFAGPGAYLDGPDGSSVVIAKTFLEHSRLPGFGNFD
jgi:hypothetical protein